MKKNIPIATKGTMGKLIIKGCSMDRYVCIICNTETKMPHRYPIIKAAIIFDTISNTITLVIYSLVHPMDLSTPSSHKESFILACKVIINWNVPIRKQIAAQVMLKKKVTFILSACV